eukprot:bmy_09198T0
MCTRGFRLGTNLCRLWPTLPGLRWLLGLGLLPGLKAARCAAFYLPGLAPVNFCEADRETAICKSSVALFVNRLDSVDSVLPYEYNTNYLIYSGKKSPSENLGQSEFNKSNTFYLFNHVDITITYHGESETNWGIVRLVTARLDPKSYKHSDENHLTCNGPPMEIPGEYTDKLNQQAVNALHVPGVKPWVLACLGFLSPANRGALMTSAILLWVLLGTSAGYENKHIKWGSRWDYILESMSHTSSQWFRHCRGNKCKSPLKLPSWLQMNNNGPFFIRQMFHLIVKRSYIIEIENQLLTVVVSWVAGGQDIVFADLFIMNLILWVEGSSAAISFGTLIGILTMSFGISVPLTFLGAYIGSKKKRLNSGMVASDLRPGLHFMVYYFFTKLQITGIANTILYFGYTMIMVLIFFLFTAANSQINVYWNLVPKVTVESLFKEHQNYCQITLSSLFLSDANAIATRLRTSAKRVVENCQRGLWPRRLSHSYDLLFVVHCFCLLMPKLGGALRGPGAPVWPTENERDTDKD